MADADAEVAVLAAAEDVVRRAGARVRRRGVVRVVVAVLASLVVLGAAALHSVAVHAPALLAVLGVWWVVLRRRPAGPVGRGREHAHG